MNFNYFNVFSVFIFDLFQLMIPKKSCTEINQFNIMVVSRTIKHHVFRFQITMDDVFLMGMSDRRKKLFKNYSNWLNFKFLLLGKLFSDVFEEISTSAQFLDQAVSFGVLKEMVHIDDAWMLLWMLQNPHALNFISKFFMSFMVHIWFAQNFASSVILNCISLIFDIFFVNTFHDITKCTLSEMTYNPITITHLDVSYTSWFKVNISLKFISNNILQNGSTWLVDFHHLFWHFVVLVGRYLLFLVWNLINKINE